VAQLKRLGALLRIGPDEKCVRVGKAHHEKRHLLSLTVPVDLGKAEIDLSFPRTVVKRYIHLLLTIGE